LVNDFSEADTMITIRQFTVALLAVPAFLTAVATAAQPQADYACHVTTSSGGPGLVLVQTASREEAIAMARRGLAATVIDTRLPVAEVVECIRRPDENFQDREFQRTFRKLPR
jgi:hypothetical protein